MKSYWLNKQGNKNLIVFFAGWSFDYYPFSALKAGEYDILFVYDYNNLSVPEDLKNFSDYDNKTLITWSMGVFTAYFLKDLFIDFECKIAVNGTVTPVDDKFGIPVKVFELTLKHAVKGLEGKFYRNVFMTENEYHLYRTSPIRRELTNRVKELENLYNLIKNKNIVYENFYDLAIVSEADKIIPPKNQIASHEKNNTAVKILPYGHFPFYNFSGWDEIIKCR